MNKKTLNWVIRIGVTVALFVVLFTRFVDPQQIVEELSDISPIWLVGAFLAQATAIYASIWRWNLLLWGQDLDIPHRHLVGTFLIGRFFGTFLPSTIGLDVYRTYDVARRAKATTESVAVLMVEKLIGFFALSMLVLFSIPAGSAFLPQNVLYFIAAAFCIPVTISFVILLRPRLVLWVLDLPFPFKSKVEGKLRQAAEAVTIYHRKKGLLFGAVVCGMIVHLSTVMLYYCTAQTIKAPVALSDMLFAGPLMIVATVGLPSIGGEGVRELTLVGLLGRVGVSESSAFVLGHLGFWVGMALSLSGGLIYLLRPASYQPVIRSLREKQAQSSEEVVEPRTPALSQEIGD